MKGLSQQEQDSLFPKNTVLAGYVGSISHNTYRPSTDPNSIDDKDVMGVYIAPITEYFGMRKPERRQQEIVKRDEWDVVVYEIAKMFSLWAAGNPNVLSLLWLNPQFYVTKTEAGQRILDNRHLFISKQVYHSFNGYAYGQLKRMEHLAYEGYMGEKRKSLVEKYGFDTKNAAHCIRILRMGIEFLSEGELHVFREDAPQLVEIKNGAWSLGQVKSEAARLFGLTEQAYVNSKLPGKVDEEAVNNLLVSILRENFK